MKTLLLLAFAVALATPPARAQGPATIKTKAKPAGQASIKTKTAVAPASVEGPSNELIDVKANALTLNMQKNLTLSPQQTEKVRVINRRGVEMVETGRARYGTDPRKLAGVVETAGRSRLEALKEVLTPAQFGKYQRKREEKMGVPNIQGVQGNPAPGMGGAGDQ